MSQYGLVKCPMDTPMDKIKVATNHFMSQIVIEILADIN